MRQGNFVNWWLTPHQLLFYFPSHFYDALIAVLFDLQPRKKKKNWVLKESFSFSSQWKENHHNVWNSKTEAKNKTLQKKYMYQEKCVVHLIILKNVIKLKFKIQIFTNII